MPGTNFLPTDEAQLVSYTTNFSDVLNADPVSFGADIATAAAFGVLNQSWIDSYAVIQNGLTRSPANIATKNNNKDACVEELRRLGGIIRNFPGITDAQLIEIGLNVPDPEPTPVPVPTMWPDLTVKSVAGYQVDVRLADIESPLSGRKPLGVVGANILTFVGDIAPADPADWSFHGNVTRLNFFVDFPITLPAAQKVWISAIWYNTKGDLSQPSPGVHTYVGTAISEAA